MWIFRFVKSSGVLIPLRLILSSIFCSDFKIHAILKLSINILSKDYQKKINKIDLRQLNQIIING